MSVRTDRIKAALERGKQDSALLDGRDFDEAFWKSTLADLADVERALEQKDEALRELADDSTELLQAVAAEWRSNRGPTQRVDAACATLLYTIKRARAALAASAEPQEKETP